MRVIAILAASFLLHASYSQNVWIKRDSVNGPPRGAAASFELNDEAFVVGGVNVEEFKRKMYSYDLDQDDWDNESPLGGETGSGLERASSVGFSAAGYGFVALGSGSASYMKDLWRYDPETESWTQMADFAGTARNGAIAFSIDHIAYVGTGQDAEELNDDFYKYDPSEDEWTQMADFPGTPRMGAVGCGVFPSAFIMMGEDNDFEYQDDVWEYNYFGNVWTQRADYMGGGRTQASAIVVDNRIFVGLGYNGIYHDDFYEYERILSLSEQEEIISLDLFPNPVVNQFTLNWSDPMFHPGIQVMDANGRNISDHFSIVKTNSTKITVNLHKDLPSGYYFVSVFDDNEFKGVKKFILK